MYDVSVPSVYTTYAESPRPRGVNLGRWNSPVADAYIPRHMDSQLMTVAVWYVL